MKNRHKTFFKATPVIQQEVKVVPVVSNEGIKISEVAGKYFLDLSKLVFGGAVITTVVNFSTDKIFVSIVAILIATTLGLAGFLTFKLFKKK